MSVGHSLTEIQIVRLELTIFSLLQVLASRASITFSESLLSVGSRLIGQYEIIFNVF